MIDYCFNLVCDINTFPQPASPGTQEAGPNLPETEIAYECDTPTMFFVNGPPYTNMCNDEGVYESLTAPTCERSK